MKLNTLNTIIDDILHELRNNNIAESEKISRVQVEQWITNYRAILIKQDIDKGRDINPMYIQTVDCIRVDRKEPVPGHFVYQGNYEIPKLIDFHFKTGLIWVKDMHGNLIQIGNETKMKYQRYRKYTCGDYIAYLKGNKVYVEGDDNLLEYISIGIIAENPADVAQPNGDCFDPDAEYPVPAHMIPTIKQMIFQNELNIMWRMPSDGTNDSKDDLQNTYSVNNPRRRQAL